MKTLFNNVRRLIKGVVKMAKDTTEKIMTLVTNFLGDSDDINTTVEEVKEEYRANYIRERHLCDWIGTSSLILGSCGLVYSIAKRKYINCYYKTLR